MFETHEPKASSSQTSRVKINLKQMSIFYGLMFKNSRFTKKKFSDDFFNFKLKS